MSSKLDSGEPTYLSSSATLRSARGRRGVPGAGSQKSYRVSSRSKRSSRVPSPRTAWKPSSGGFVFRDQHAASRLPEQLLHRQEGLVIGVGSTSPPYLSAPNLGERPLLRAWVNKGKKGRSVISPGPIFRQRPADSRVGVRAVRVDGGQNSYSRGQK
jgi:hypothetical protein